MRILEVIPKTIYNDKLVISETIGQFIGLHDVEGKEIYEGYIVEFGYKSYL